jgi:hypothetical protein
MKVSLSIRAKAKQFNQSQSKVKHQLTRTNNVRNVFSLLGNDTHQGKILQRFPEKDWPDTPFIEGMELVSDSRYKLVVTVTATSSSFSSVNLKAGRFRCSLKSQNTSCQSSRTSMETITIVPCCRSMKKCPSRPVD